MMHGCPAATSVGSHGVMRLHDACCCSGCGCVVALATFRLSSPPPSLSPWLSGAAGGTVSHAQECPHGGVVHGGTVACAHRTTREVHRQPPVPAMQAVGARRDGQGVPHGGCGHGGGLGGPGTGGSAGGSGSGWRYRCPCYRHVSRHAGRSCGHCAATACSSAAGTRVGWRRRRQGCQQSQPQPTWRSVGVTTAVALTQR